MSLTNDVKEYLSSADDKDPSDYAVWRMGLSMCSTWSWGASIAVGIAIMHSMGFLAFLGWTFGNILAIPFFGFVRTKVPHTGSWSNFTPFLLLFAFIHFFAIVMNLSALQSVLGGGTDITSVAILPQGLILPTVMAVGFSIVYFIHKTKLIGSITTDAGQYALQILGALAIIGLGLFSTGRPEIALQTAEGWSWLPAAFLGIITGVTASGMQWQRIESMDSDRDRWFASLYGGAFFGAYMVLVTMAGLVFTGGLAQTLALLVVIGAVATSTTDSGAAGQYFVAEKFGIKGVYATIVSLSAVVFYPIVADLGLVAIWNIYGGTRWKIVVGFLIATLLYSVTRGVIDYTSVQRFMRKTKLLLE